MDFGRISIDDELVLYLFGTPGPEPLLVHVGRPVRGAIGAVVLVDTRRLEDCFGPLDFFEARGLPFVVAVNAFDGRSGTAPTRCARRSSSGPRYP